MGLGNLLYIDYQELILTAALDYIQENWSPMVVAIFCSECRVFENPVGKCYGCGVTLFSTCGPGRLHVERRRGGVILWVCTKCAMHQAYLPMDPAYEGQEQTSTS
jgi:hypothetical protein